MTLFTLCGLPSNQKEEKQWKQSGDVKEEKERKPGYIRHKGKSAGDVLNRIRSLEGSTVVAKWHGSVAQKEYLSCRNQWQEKKSPHNTWSKGGGKETKRKGGKKEIEDRGGVPYDSTARKKRNTGGKGKARASTEWAN